MQIPTVIVISRVPQQGSSVWYGGHIPTGYLILRQQDDFKHVCLNGCPAV